MPDAFSPSAQGLLNPPYYKLGGRGNFSCVQNPTKAEFMHGIYKPRLTLTKRQNNGGFIITLRIEFSAPKLLYGNNFDELVDADFSKVLDILHRKVLEMGIRVHIDALRNAPVSAIHYSKNIALTDYSTCSMITGELEKIDLTKRLDLSKTDFRNEGHAIRYHANSFEVSFYDKLKDLQQAKVSEKRAIEKDNAIQADLFRKHEYLKQLEVLRMEVRLGNRTKIRSMLTALEIKVEPTFCALFDKSIAQKILHHFWQTATTDMPLLELSAFKPEDAAYAMITDSKGKTKPAKLLQHIGALALIHSIGMRATKALLEKQCNPRTWQRIKKELDELDINSNMKYQAMRHVDRALKEYEPLKLKTFRTETFALAVQPE